MLPSSTAAESFRLPDSTTVPEENVTPAPETPVATPSVTATLAWCTRRIPNTVNDDPPVAVTVYVALAAARRGVPLILPVPESIESPCGKSGTTLQYLGANPSPP